MKGDRNTLKDGEQTLECNGNAFNNDEKALKGNGELLNRTRNC